MPLTFPSHAAAILPLLRVRRLFPAALVVGSCAPDFAYLFGFWSMARPFHEAGGVVLCLPFALLVWVGFERWILPGFSRVRLSALGIDLTDALRTRGLPTSWRAWAWALLSLAFGTATHIIWDGFTHATRWPARILYSAGPLASALQQLSHVVGLVLVLRYARRHFPAQAAARRPLWTHPLGFIPFAGACAGAVLALALSGRQPAYATPWLMFWVATRTALLAMTAAAVPVSASQRA